MKIITRILAAATTLSMLATGCINEDPAYKKGNSTDPTDPKTTGYLSLGQTSLRVVYDANTEASDENTSGETNRPKTRATEPDVNTFIVEITKASDNTSVYKKTYGEMKTELVSNALELEVGSYKLSVRSEEAASSPAAAMEHPVYGTTRDFAITKGQTSTINEMVCTLQNIKVTVACSPDLIDQLVTTSKSTVSLGSNSIDFALTETGAAFFMPAAELNALNFKMQGAFKETPEKAVSFSKAITNVKAGQWRKITLVITYASNGGINFDINVDNFVLDDEITVNGAAGLWEQIIDEEPDIDPTAPTIVWADHDLSQNFQLKASMFSTDENNKTVCTEPFKFNVTSANGIKAFNITISSDNTEFMTSLTGRGLGGTFDLCTLDNTTMAYTILSAFGFPLGNELKGAKTSSFNIAGAMPMLYSNPGFEGQHSFAFAVTDANGLTTNATLRLLVDKNNESGEVAPAPTIVWTGYDIDQQYTVEEGMAVNLVVNAPAGIKTAEVNIISDGLDALALSGVGIPAQFDLCNVQGIQYDDPNTADLTPEEVAGNLKSLGFPVNDEIKGKTTPVDLSISSIFIGLMINAAPGLNQFEITVTDNNSQSIKKTLKLYVPEK